MQRDGAVLNMVLRIFLRVIAQSLSVHCPGAARVDRAALHIGAVAFIHRFGSSLNAHVHFHVCVVDGVFEVAAGEADAQATAPSVIFHPASGVDETTVAQVQADLRRRILRAFVGRGLIDSVDAKEMLAYQHSGFSVNASVCIEAHDRAALERLLRYCARPPFAMDRLRKEGELKFDATIQMISVSSLLRTPSSTAAASPGGAAWVRPCDKLVMACVLSKKRGAGCWTPLEMNNGLLGQVRGERSSCACAGRCRRGGPNTD